MEEGHSARKNTHGSHVERRGPEITRERDRSSHTSGPAQPSLAAIHRNCGKGGHVPAANGIWVQGG